MSKKNKKSTKRAQHAFDVKSESHMSNPLDFFVGRLAWKHPAGMSLLLKRIIINSACLWIDRGEARGRQEAAEGPEEAAAEGHARQGVAQEEAQAQGYQNSQGRQNQGTSPLSPCPAHATQLPLLLPMESPCYRAPRQLRTSNCAMSGLSQWANARVQHLKKVIAQGIKITDAASKKKARETLEAETALRKMEVESNIDWEEAAGSDAEAMEG